MGAVSAHACIGQGSSTNMFVNQMCNSRHYTRNYLNALYSCEYLFWWQPRRWLVTADSSGGLPTTLQTVRHIHHGVYPASRENSSRGRIASERSPHSTSMRGIGQWA
jgi:hypothetical protein